MNGLHRVNEVYTIYYDETNNIRRLHVTADGLNVKEPKCFVLGGIAHEGPARDLDFESLRSTLRLQKTTAEIKLKHIGKGDFLDMLSSTKVEVFLNWIIEQGLFYPLSGVGCDVLVGGRYCRFNRRRSWA